MKLLFCTFFLALAATAYSAVKIAGGTNVLPGRYTYQASIRYRNYNFTHGCGASIINKRWILTAEHCLYNDTTVTPYQPKDLKVLVGTTKADGRGGQIYEVENIVFREWLNNTGAPTGDIGLIRVDRDIKFDRKVRPVNLPKEDFTKVDYPAVLIGWGQTKVQESSGKLISNDLQEISLKIIAQSECEKTWKGNTSDTESYLCTFTKIGEGACYGDSGGPLVADGVQVGIAVSIYDLNCGTGKPDFFTRVYTFVPWINKEISKFENKI